MSKDLYKDKRVDEISKETAKEILVLLGEGFDETKMTEFKNLPWYKSFCIEIQDRYDIENRSMRKQDYKVSEHKTEKERLETYNKILTEALEYMFNSYGIKLSMTKLDDGIEYSCNGYVVDKDTYLTLNKAIHILDIWE